MAGNALIDTSNRLLDWSTNDFSLYGGQAAVTIGAPAAPARGSGGLSVPDPAASTARSAQPEASPIHQGLAQAVSEPQGPTESDFHFTSFASAPILSGDPAHAQALGAQVPAAPGSGAPASPAIDAIHAPATVPTAVPGLTPPTLAVEQPEATAPTLASFGGLAAPVLALHGSVDDTLSSVNHAVSTVVTATDTLINDVQQSLEALPLVSDISAADPLLDGAQQTLDALPLVPDLAATHPLPQVSDITSDDFLGSDPIGGVATLVSMVDSTDAFDLAHVGIDIPDVAPSSSVLETLADEPVGALLGDVNHGVDTILPDHSHDGVLGL